MIHNPDSFAIMYLSVRVKPPQTVLEVVGGKRVRLKILENRGKSMQINVQFDSIKEMDDWVARMGQPIQVQQHINVVTDDSEKSITDPSQEAKEEKPKATRKRKASKPKVVKDEAPQTPSTEPPYVEDEKTPEVATETTAEEPAKEEPAKEEPAKEEPAGNPLEIKNNQQLVGFLQNIFGGAGNDNIKQALAGFDGGLPNYIDKNIKSFEAITTDVEALAVLKDTLGLGE